MKKSALLLITALICVCASAKYSHRIEDIPYITKQGVVAVRQIEICIPQDVAGPVPVVFVPHYNSAPESKSCQRYLENGWAVVSPVSTPEMNAVLSDDNLVFNNAILYHIRHQDEFDSSRIMLNGGSAGGYTSLMLSGLQLGICAIFAESPLINLYFNFYHHFRDAAATDARMPDNSPFKVIESIQGVFLRSLDNFPDGGDVERWEKLSPIGLAKCTSCPILIDHYTSDMLVPIDQLTRAFTHEEAGESVPEGYSVRLDPAYPGILGHSYEEEAIPGSCWKTVLPYEERHDFNLPFDSGKRLNIVVIDDGPAEAWAGHRASKSPSVLICHDFFKEKIAGGLAVTEEISAQKMHLLLERYLGRSLQLPAHEGVDDGVYGSLKIYKEEIVEGLSTWVGAHSVKELDAIAASASNLEAGKAGRREYRKAWKEIRSIIKERNSRL